MSFVLPTTPTGLAAQSGNAGEFVVTWNPVVMFPPITAYTVSYGIGTFTAHQTVNDGTEMLTISGLPAGTYKVTISANNTHGESPTAAEVTVWVRPAIPTPPNPLPPTVLERIVDDLIYVMGQINPANGYADTVTATRPNPGLGNSLLDGRVIVFVGDPEKQDGPCLYTQWNQHLHLLCQVVESEASLTTIQERLNLIRAEVEYAVAGSEASWRRSISSGVPLAETTELEGAIFEEADPDAHDGQVQINIAVQYRTQLNNAFKSIQDS